jgi:hypothetical protein
MPLIEYRSINFRPKSLEIIEQANRIAEAYARQGLSLTLRQLYYRFVAADLIPNKQTEYKRLGSIIGDARYAGLFDWGLITDRTRNVQGGDSGYTPGHPEEVINPRYYGVTQWEGQPYRVEAWVEKDALIDVVSQATSPLRVPRFSCRGYTSSSEIWAAARRIEGYLDDPEVEKVIVLHLGDHDPSGIDMTRDIGARVLEFVGGDGYRDWDVEIKRIALNMNQIEQYNPPPNPAKETDSRFEGYREIYGDESWELDALEPRTLIDLIQDNIRPLIDADKWAERSRITAEGQATLKAVRDNYDDVIAFLTERGLMPEIEIEDDLTTEDEDE